MCVVNATLVLRGVLTVFSSVCEAGVGWGPNFSLFANSIDFDGPRDRCGYDGRIFALDD